MEVNKVVTAREAIEQGLVKVGIRQMTRRCQNNYYKDCRQLGKEWIINKKEIMEREKNMEKSSGYQHKIFTK